MWVSFKDLQEAFEFVSAGGGDEHEAFLCRRTGKIYCHSELVDDLDALPDDIGDGDKFLQIPDKHDLDLGKRQKPRKKPCGRGASSIQLQSLVNSGLTRCRALMRLAKAKSASKHSFSRNTMWSSEEASMP